MEFLKTLEQIQGLQEGFASLDKVFDPTSTPSEDKAHWSQKEAQAQLLANLNPTQKEFVSDLKTLLLALIGGYGSGKTRALCAKAIFNLLEMPGLDGMVVMATAAEFEEIWDPVFMPMLEEHGLEIVRYQRAPARILTVKVLGLTSRVYCYSGDKKNRIRGANVAWGLIDEIDRYPYPENTWKNAMARVRVGENPQLAAGSTPEGYRFLFRTFAEEGNKDKTDRRYLSMSTYENEHNLTEGYIEKLKSSYASTEFEAYVHGRFANLATGTVYDVFDRRIHVRDFSWHRPPKRTKVLVGMDFNVDNCNAVLAYAANDSLWVFDEIKKAHDTTTLCEQIYLHRQAAVERERGSPNERMQRITAFPDATAGASSTNAATTDLDILEQYGLLIGSGASNPLIRDRVQTVRASLRNTKGEVHLWIHPRCTHLIDCLERQAYDDHNLPDKKEGWDHMNDALGYLVYWHQPMHSHKALYRRDSGKRSPLLSSASDQWQR